jgi:hypothetical protein
MVWLTGGLARYVEASRDLAETVVRPTTIVTGPFEVTLRMSRYVLESILVGLGPLALAAALLPWYGRRYGFGRREAFLLVWTAPSVLVCTLVHFGQAGYVLTFLPALVILLAHVLLRALADASRHLALPRARAVLTTAAVVMVVCVNGAFFVSARPLVRDFDGARPGWAQTARDDAFDWIFSRTAAALREHEAVVATFVTAIRELYDPADTAIIAELGNRRSYPWLRHAMFYLPEFTVYEIRVGELPPGYYAPRTAHAMIRAAASEIRLPATITRLVWFVDHWSPDSERPPGLTEIELPHGRFLYALPMGRRLQHAGYTFVKEEPERPARHAAR